MSEELKPLITDLMNYKNSEKLREWARVRSPVTYLKETNRHQPAILIINSWNDSLFNPNPAMDYFPKLKGRKRLILREGIHGSAEATGLLGLDNAAWDEVFQWFEQSIGRSRPVRSAAKPMVKMQRRGSKEMISYLTWPHTKIDSRTFSLHSEEKVLQIETGLDSVASTGLPIVGSFLDSHTPWDIGFWWWRTRWSNAFVIETEPVSSPLKVRGDAVLSMRLRSSDKVAQVYVYLYSISPLGYARLMTHGPHRLSVRPNRWQTHSVRLFTTVFDLPAGHRLGIVVDTIDPTYRDEKRAPSQLEWSLSSSLENCLQLPLEK